VEKKDWGGGGIAGWHGRLGGKGASVAYKKATHPPLEDAFLETGKVKEAEKEKGDSHKRFGTGRRKGRKKPEDLRTFSSKKNNRPWDKMCGKKKGVGVGKKTIVGPGSHPQGGRATDSSSSKIGISDIQEKGSPSVEQEKNVARGGGGKKKTSKKAKVVRR